MLVKILFKKAVSILSSLYNKTNNLRKAYTKLLTLYISPIGIYMIMSPSHRLARWSRVAVGNWLVSKYFLANIGET